MQDGTIKQIAQIKVSQNGESGLHGITIDPNFNQNHFVYIYYTYASENNNSLNRVSRFIFDPDLIGVDGQNLKDEKIIELIAEFVRKILGRNNWLKEM